MDEPSYSSLKDYFFLLPTGLLFLKISCSMDGAGISGKTQILNAVVILLRCISYIGLPSFPVHAIIVNLLGIIFAYGTVLMVFIVFKDVYNSNEDNFRLDYLLVPAAVVGICLPENCTMYNLCTIFSASLEAVFIIPQYLYTCKKNHYNVVLPLYLVFLMFYATFCLVQNIVYSDDIVRFDPLMRIGIASGFMQLVLYNIFAVRLYKRQKQGFMKFNTSKEINVDKICNESAPSAPILVE